MKKLVLALVCLVSVAFFASCNREVGDPTIQVYTEEGCVVDGANVDINTPVLFGFKVASDAISGKELKSLVISVDGDQRVSVDLTGMTSYTFIDTITYGLDRDGILLGQSTISAILTDGNNRTATANITLNVYNPAQPLVTKDFEWNRHGGAAATGLAEFGLEWTSNAKEIYAGIKPVEGAMLCSFNSDVWETTTNEAEKAALFSEAVKYCPY